MDCFLTRLTNISPNTQAHVIVEIRRQERMHPFWGLRTSEEFVRDRTAAIEETLRSLRRSDRKLRRMQLKLDQLNQLESIDEFQQLDREDLEDQMLGLRSQAESIEPMLRDARMELATAWGEKVRILTTYPALQQSPEELQGLTRDALIAKEAFFFAGKIAAARQGLPESTSEFLAMMLPEEQELIMAEAHRALGHSVNPMLSQQMATLAKLSPEQQHQVLQQAVSIIQSEPPDEPQ